MANIYGTGHLGGNVPPRQAESADTRQAIREHERDQRRRKSGDGRQDGDALLNQDDEAVVSVEALRIFLENFIRSAAQEQVQSAEMNEESIEMPQEAQAPALPSQAPYAAQAAKAYQSAAHAGRPDLSGAHFDQGQAQSLGLQGENMRMVLTLIEDLKALSASGVEHLKVERAENFLNSLLLAVDKAKTL